MRRSYWSAGPLSMQRCTLPPRHCCFILVLPHFLYLSLSLSLASSFSLLRELFNAISRIAVKLIFFHIHTAFLFGIIKNQMARSRAQTVAEWVPSSKRVSLTLVQAWLMLIALKDIQPNVLLLPAVSPADRRMQAELQTLSLFKAFFCFVLNVQASLY